MEGDREGKKAERRFPLPLARLLEDLQANGQPRPHSGYGERPARGHRAAKGQGQGQEQGLGQSSPAPRPLREWGFFVQRESPSAA